MKLFFQTSLLFSSLAALTFVAVGCSGPKPETRSIASVDTGIIGGEPVEASDEIATSTVGLEIPFTGGTFCSAVLIAKNLVVTAGHCSGATARPNQMNVVFGTDLKGQLVRRKVLGGRVPDAWPKLNPAQNDNWGDIAVLRFEGEAPEGFKPARLLPTTKTLKNDMEVVLAGYGLTNMDPETDPEKMMKVAVKLTNPQFSETELMFAQLDGKGACHGDSGGPAYAVIRKKLYLIGVTSRSATEAGGETCLEGSIYTSIPGHIAFLKKAAKELNASDFVPNQPIPQPSDEF